jgi:hypothetical protein
MVSSGKSVDGIDADSALRIAGSWANRHRGREK